MVNVYQYTTLRDAQGRVIGYQKVDAAHPYIDTNPSHSAIGIVTRAAARGEAVTPGLLSVAYGQGYTGDANLMTTQGKVVALSAIQRGEVSISDIDSGIHTIQTRQPASKIPTTQEISEGGTVDLYTPYGDYAQIRVEDVKLLIDPTTGELAAYQKASGHSIYNLASGAGRNALQSGAFTIEEAQTPYVIEQWARNATRPSGEGLSRLGAEAYGGYVMPLDERTIQSTGATYSTYSNLFNLANLVNPQGVNLSKREAPGAKIPWSVSEGSPAIQMMNETGIIPGSAVAAPGMITKTRVVGGAAKLVQATPVDAGQYGLPSPVKSKTETIIGFNPLTAAASMIPGPLGVILGAATVPTSPSGIQAYRELGESVRTMDIGATYEGLNKVLAPATTDIMGQGRSLQLAPDVTTGIGIQTKTHFVGITAGEANLAKGIVVGVSQHPLDIPLSYGGGKAIALGEGVLRLGVARAAMSQSPRISMVGRAFSSPVAGDVMKLAKVGIGSYIIYESGKHILGQPTAAGKGEALGRTAVQFTGFGVGYGSVPIREPVNEFTGRGFFSKKLEVSPLERLQFKAETTLRSLATENPAAYREVATIAASRARVTEPTIRKEPEFSILTRSGEYAVEIKGTLKEQPHSVIGSSATIQQYSKAIAEESRLRIGKDVDAFIESPKRGISTLTERARIGEEEAKAVLDLHPIPKNYPGYKPSTELEIVEPESSTLTTIFGDPYRKIATARGTSEIVKPGMKGYRGELAYESSQVQFGRKAAGAAVVIESPITKGYRAEKDIYDFITTYEAQKRVAIEQGAQPDLFAKSDKAMASFMERTLTFGTEKGQRELTPETMVTMKVRDIYTKMSEETALQRRAYFAGEAIAGEIETTGSRMIPEKGMASTFIGAIPSQLFIKSGSPASRISGPQAFPSIPSEPEEPSAPEITSEPPSALSRVISSISGGSQMASSIWGRSPRSPVSPPPGSSQPPYPRSPSSRVPSVPSSPPGSPGSSIRSPPTISPPSPPSTPSTTTTTIPPSLPPATPPLSPPSSPPSSPPIPPPEYPPKQPPIEPPILLGGLPGGGGGTPIAYVGRESWTYRNPVGADILGETKGRPIGKMRIPKFKGMKEIRFPKF